MYRNLKQITTFVFLPLLVIVAGFYIYTSVQHKSNKIDNEKKVSVSGNAIMEIENCKDPSAENGLRPYDYVVISVREGDSNDFNKPIVATTIADKDGMFSFKLVPGKYCAIFKDKVEKGELSSEPFTTMTPTGELAVETLDVSCYEDYLSKCDAVLDVPKDGLSNVVMTYVAKCKEPCVNYE